jgi:Arylsulfotransferase (ASST)
VSSGLGDIDGGLSAPARRRAIGALAGAFVLAAACLGPAAASAAGAPAVVISPLAGTPDANPATQISFLGVAASHLQDIVVTGSTSGSHSGSLRYYSTHTGGSFLPASPFTPGEHVTVSATVTGYGAPVHIGTSFDVSSPYALPSAGPSAPVRATPQNTQRFHSRHDLEPPAVTVTTPASDPSLGDIFVSPDGGAGQAGPMIVSPIGKLIWFDPLPSSTTAFDLNVQNYQGVPVLTWWQGQVVEGHGQGVDMIESNHYTPIAAVHAGNGLYADLHDFEITPQGTAWITAFAPQHRDLSPLGGMRDGLLDDGVIQEIDIKTGLVMFEWHALGHVAISDTYMNIPHGAGKVLDYFHPNSIDPLSNGEVLVSSRNTWTTYLISEATGAVLWRLGGKHSSFSLGSGVKFAWQHDAQLLPDGTISLFDNEAAPAEAKQSRALDIAIDTNANTATVVRQLTYPGQGILSNSQGDVQLLPNGDDLVGWGQAGEVSEFSPSNQITFDMHFSSPANTYRAFRFPWSAQPSTPPALQAASASHGARELWASWNGATDVAGWRVLAGNSASSLRSVGKFASTGFETAIRAPTTARYLRVQALSSTGSVLGTSALSGG